MHILSKSQIHTHIEFVTGKTMIISGGTTGIGRAAAELFASYGAKVLIFGRHVRELNDAVSDIEQVCAEGGEITGMIADQARSEDVKKVFKKADSLWDKLDILINNAALSADGVMDMEKKDWKYILAANLSGYIECTQEAARRMKKNKSGHIINVGSMSADEREGGDSIYVATKAAVQGFTESLRKELNEHGIKVTLIEPGRVGTDMQEESPKEQMKMEKNLEMLKAQDIAVCMHYCLTQPKRCDIVEVKIRPHLQLI